MSREYHDLVIIGSGPAGLAAAIYAARAELDFVVVEKEPMSGGQIINTYEVDNYPGLPGLAGFDLAMKFREHCDKLGVTHVMKEVKTFECEGDKKILTFGDGNQIEAKAVVIATGAKSRKLGAPGEEKLTGMGVSYCATCDGAFFRNRTTAVIGGGDVAVEDAIFLARMCKEVYVIHRRDEFRAAKTLSTKLLSLENVKVCWNHVVEEIQGDDMVTGIQVKDVVSGEVSTIAVDGVFVAVGTTPNSALFKDVVACDSKGYIIADETGKTNVPGIFAAGDVRTKELRQVITAASDGANVITSVERYFIS